MSSPARVESRPPHGTRRPFRGFVLGSALGVVLTAWVAGPLPLRAVSCNLCPGGNYLSYVCAVDQTLTTDERPCLSIVNCVQPRMDGPTVQAVDQGGETYQVRLFVDVRTPFNSDPDAFTNGKLNIAWTEGPSINNPGDVCQNYQTDRTWSFLAFGDMSCDDVPATVGTYSVRAVECNGGSCQHDETEEGKELTVTRQTFGCIEERTWSCPEDASCRQCLGPGGSSPAGGGGPGIGLDGSGPGATLRYAAGGTGSVGTVGAAAWSETLGQSWSHDYAIRIVPDPDETHVWLLTEAATFREFADADADGIYTVVRPTSEKRLLEWTGSGWTLTELDGTVHSFGADGRWLATTSPEGNATTGTYDVDGRLERVDFPDGRHEVFTYDVVGKLASITEVGVDDTTSRTWEYLWAGDDLVRIDRPDGRAWELFYEDLRFPGYMTRMELVADVSGQGGSSDVNQRKAENRRVERAWEYDAAGNVSHTWRGAASWDDLEAVDHWEFTYDDPMLPTQTTVTDPLGDDSVYTFASDRDSVHDRAKPLSISGGCPVCDLGPNVQLQYTDSANPLLPTRIVDGRGIATTMEYDAHGQMTSRTEADGGALMRTTEWTYDQDFPALPASMSQPSVAGGMAKRGVTWGYDANGNPTSRTISGIEDGSAFSHPTVTSYNAAGQPVSIDPAGHDANDVTSFTYDSARGDLYPVTRAVPLPGSGAMTTTFGYDPFNRRTSVTDPNGLETATSYDPLDRMIEVRQLGLDPPNDDLVTTHVYDKFGDLVRTILPRGNVIEYGYDHAGRLVSIERKPDADPDHHGERTVYTLDAAGNRTAEQLQRWDGVAESWVTESSTGFLYTNRCRVHSVTRGSSTTSYSYDCNGNLDAVWDPTRDPDVDPPSTTYGYDALDRLVMISQPWGGAGGGTVETLYGYDVQDHLTSVTDAEGNTTTYSYSDRDLLTEETAPVGELAKISFVHTEQRPSSSGGRQAEAVTPPTATTTYMYDKHGELIETTDARGITVHRTVDPLDRVTFIDYPDDTLDTTFSYDTAPAACTTSAPIGRLGSIIRNGASVDFCYDHFGRQTRDGELTYGYDANGNRTTIGYPGGVSASYGHDFADRQDELTVTTPAETARPVASGVSYLPSGPLSAVTLGSPPEGGVTESRAYDGRYAPERFEITAPFERVWTYGTDPVGNVTSITERIVCASSPLVLTNQTVTTSEIWEWCTRIEAGDGFVVGSGGDVTFRAANGIALGDGFSVLSGGSFVAETAPVTGTVEVERSFSYQPDQYFLTSADGAGSGGGDLEWTYDRIGNRLTETRDGGTPDTYQYVDNDASGNTPILDQVVLGAGGTHEYQWDAAGNLDQVAAGANVIDFQFDHASRMSSAARPAAEETVGFTYDGRGYLRSAVATEGDPPTESRSVEPVYDSAGLLHVLRRRASPSADQDLLVHLYLAGRPVAQLAIDGTTGTETWTYLTTDHLGTPVLATDDMGAVVWDGGFQPFGEDPDAGTAQGALQNGIHLRLPGQWDDPTWADATSGAGVYYNVHRWYQPGTGRYTRPDPIREVAGLYAGPALYLVPGNSYLYAGADPLRLIDPQGLTFQQALCTLKYSLVGFGAGGFGGAVGGCLAGASGGVFVGGVGALPGCAGGAFVGGVLGAGAGAVGGGLLGVLNCRCPSAEEDPKREECYDRYLAETADCGSRFTDDYDYNRCMDNAWRNYIKCLNGLPPKPFVP